MEESVRSVSAAQTRAWGGQLGRCLRGGDVVALVGDLGAGKTAFAQGVGEALAVEGPMTSPTFILIQEYPGQAEEKPVQLVHMDLYRLRHPEEAAVIGVEDCFREDAVCLIEWPEIMEELLPADCLRVVISGSGEEPREILFQAEGETWRRRLLDMAFGA